MVEIKQFHVYVADLGKPIGSEVGKQRPVVVIQTDLLNQAKLTRVHLKKAEAGLVKDSDILCDQIKAIDNKRLIKHLGCLSVKHQIVLKEIMMLLLFE